MAKKDDLSEFGFEPEEETGLEEFGFEADEVDMSQLEAGARGTAQGLTLDFADELQAAAESMGQDIGSVLGLTEPLDEEPVTFDEQGRPIIPESSGQPYRERLKEIRDEYKKAQDQHPVTYYGADVASGILPALLTGGAGTVGSVGKSLAKGATKSSLGKSLGKAALTGAGYGAATGAGVSEEEDIEGVAKDTVIGSVLGGVTGAGMPLAGKAAKEGLGLTGKFLGGAANLVPGAEAVNLGYQAGKRGIKVSQEAMLEEGLRVAKKFQESIKKVLSDSGVERSEAVKIADKAGIKINAGESIDEVINEIVDTGAIGLEMKQREKLVKNISALKKGFAEQQEIMKLESKAANQAVREKQLYNAEPEMVTEINTKYNDATIKPEAEGTVKGLKTKYSINTPEGKVEYDKILTKPLDDDIVKRIEYDVESMSPSQVERLLGYVNDNLVGDVSKKAANKNESYARRLAISLRGKLDDAVGEFADPTGAMAKSYKGSKKLGVDDIGNYSQYVINDNIDKIAKKLLSTGSASEIDKRRAFEYFRKASPELEGVIEEAEFISKLNDKLGGMTEGVRTTNLKGLFGTAEGAAAKVFNLAGRGVKKVTDPFKKANGKIANKVTDMTDDQLMKSSKTFLSSEKPAIIEMGKRLQFALQQEGAVKSAAIWSLSQQPAFRQIIKKQLNKQEEGMAEDLGIEPITIGDPENYREPQGIVEDSVSTTMSAPMDESVEMESGRSPIDDLKSEGFFNKFSRDQLESSFDSDRALKDAVDESESTKSQMDSVFDKESASNDLQRLLTNYVDIKEKNNIISPSRVVEDTLSELYQKEGKGDFTGAAPTGNLGMTASARRTVGMQKQWEDAKTEEERDELDVIAAEKYLSYLFEKMPESWKENPEDIQKALLDTSFNLGEGIFRYKRLNKGIEEGDLQEAAKGLLDSANVNGMSSKGVAKRRAQAYNNLANSSGFSHIQKVEQESDGTIIYYDDSDQEVLRYDPPSKKIHPSSRPGILEIENEVQKNKDREGKQLGTGAIAGTDRATLDDLMGSLNKLRGHRSEQEVADMEEYAMAGDMNMLQEMMDKYKGTMS